MCSLFFFEIVFNFFLGFEQHGVSLIQARACKKPAIATHESVDSFACSDSQALVDDHTLIVSRYFRNSFIFDLLTSIPASIVDYVTFQTQNCFHPGKKIQKQTSALTILTVLSLPNYSPWGVNTEFEFLRFTASNTIIDNFGAHVHSYRSRPGGSSTACHRSKFGECQPILHYYQTIIKCHRLLSSQQIYRPG